MTAAPAAAIPLPDAAVPAVAPAIPAAVTPVVPVPPAVPEVDDPVVVEDEEVPLAVMDDENETVNDPELEELEDEEVPLANSNLTQSTRHRIMHIIELIMAVAMSVFYVGDTKKQEKEISKLKTKFNDKEKR